MQTVRVRYFGVLRTIAGKREERVEVPRDATVRLLLDVLVNRYGDRFRDTVEASDGSLRSHIAILLDDKNINDAQGLDTKLEGAGETHLIGMVTGVGGGAEQST